MIIQCEACKTKFRVGDDKVKPPGIKVRCSKCGEVFFFEYNIHEEQSVEPEPNPFNDGQPDIPNDSPEVRIKPEIDTQPDFADFTPPETSEIQISSSETEEVTPASSEPRGESIEQSDKSIDAGNQQNEDDLSSYSFQNLEIDPLDDIAENPESQQVSSTQVVNKVPEQRQGTGADELDKDEFRSPELIIDQDVLEQTYTKGTVATSIDKTETQHPSTSKSASVKRHSRDGGGSFIKKFFGWSFSIILIALLFLVSLFLLNESKIYSNDYYNRFDNFARGLFMGGDERALNKNIRIQDVNGSWQSSKYGQVYIVKGTAVNISVNPINYLKLSVNYMSDGSTVFQQELYAGNTLSRREIKNNSFKSLQAKLNRLNGDINYEDTSNLDGLNFDIQPGEKIPFYSIFPAKEKILGLKYGIKVVGYDSVKINENP